MFPKPRSFASTSVGDLSRGKMISAVNHGVAGSAMMGFSALLTADEIETVVDFVRDEFMESGRRNTRYHTTENGWPDHEKYRDAFPFALGQVAIDTDWGALTSELRAGKQLFLSACVSCHDRGYVEQEGTLWESRPLSYPRNGYSHRESQADSVSGASAYGAHETAPKMEKLNVVEREGEKIFQQNCAFCHAADGTGRNWIGSFLDAHPRDLTAARVAGMSDVQLVGVIREGIKETTMSAWKNVLSDDQIRAIVAYIRRAFIAPRDTSTSN